MDNGNYGMRMGEWREVFGKLGDRLPAGRLRDLWNGDMPLPQVFWVYFFATVFALKVLGTALGSAGSIFTILSLAWAGVMIWPVTASAEKYTGDPNWALWAKIGSILIGLALLADVIAF